MGQKKAREFEHRKIYLEPVEGERTEWSLWSKPAKSRTSILPMSPSGQKLQTSDW